jgi:chemotaxis methyl-accepting protein methylase
VAGFDAYLAYLRQYPEELAVLVKSLTIKYSTFFREALALEYLREHVVPSMLDHEADGDEHGLRIWSAGCARGEEPYSLAMLLRDAMSRHGRSIDVAIFATDIDAQALEHAREARYPVASIAHIPYALAARYCEILGESAQVNPCITRMVRFSVHDMLDRLASAPAESIFGGFDLILCRNLLIYFTPDAQATICGRLYRSLAPGGYLLLGRTETLAAPWVGQLSRVTDCCPLYRKPARRDGSHG